MTDADTTTPAQHTHQQVVPGHVHVVAGDITRLHCDAWLLPTDRFGYVTRPFRGAPEVRPVVDADSRRVPGVDFGDRRVMRLPFEAGRRVFMGHVGRRGASAEWYAAVVDPFVAMASEGRQDADVPPVVAMPVVGTGYGGGAGKRGQVIRAILRRACNSATRRGVDVVLVCHSPEDYSAAQRVRRQLIDEGELGDDPWKDGASGAAESTARRLARHAQHGELVLFIGAGVSAGVGLPDWQGLLDDLAVEALEGEAAGMLDDLHLLDLRDQAAWLSKRLRRDLHDEIVGRLAVTAKHSLTHGHLASLPTREAVTTNYDDLFETAVRGVGQRIAVMPKEPVGGQGRWLMKLHGDLATAGLS